MRTTLIFSALTLGALLLAGCSGGSDSTSTTGTPSPTGPPDATKKLRIAVIPKGQTHDFWKSIHAGADKAAAELGNVEVVWKGPETENDREQQIKIVQDFITQKVDGIVLAPLDDKALAAPVIEAQTAGVPVLIIDSGLVGAETVSFVATDNYEAGKKGGMKMVELLGTEPKKVILLRYQEGSASTAEREKGFLDALATAKNITVISSDQYAGATRESAMKAAENLMARFKGQFDGVLCPNESSTGGMLNVLRSSGVAGKVRFVGFDSAPDLVDALKTDEINALVVQNPVKMGYEGVKMMVEHLKKATVAKKLDTGAELATKQNMSEPNIAALIGTGK